MFTHVFPQKIKIQKTYSLLVASVLTSTRFINVKFLVYVFNALLVHVRICLDTKYQWQEKKLFSYFAHVLYLQLC